MVEEPAGPVGLPPGQRRVAGLPRFGTQLHHRSPEAPGDPALVVHDAGAVHVEIPLDRLSTALPRREQVSDLHCVAGWSAVGLMWSGVPFREFWRLEVEPVAGEVSHVVLVGLDGYRIVAALQDLLADDVLLADRLHGAPITADEGAPLRLISPSQYAYVSTKHLCRIELHASEPAESFHGATALSRALMLPPLFSRHPRSRVWREERNRVLPNRFVRPAYRLLAPPLLLVNRLGARRGLR